MDKKETTSNCVLVVAMSSYQLDVHTTRYEVAIKLRLAPNRRND